MAESILPLSVKSRRHQRLAILASVYAVCNDILHFGSGSLGFLQVARFSIKTVSLGITPTQSGVGLRVARTSVPARWLPSPPVWLCLSLPVRDKTSPLPRDAHLSTPTAVSSRRNDYSNLLEARVIITTYNQHVRLLSPKPWLVRTTKAYSGLGADIVMESFSQLCAFHSPFYGQMSEIEI